LRDECNNGGNEWHNQTPGRGIITRSLKEAKVFLSDPRWVHLIVNLSVQENVELVKSFEEDVYPPGSTTNDNFHLQVTQWQGILWAIVSIPRSDERAAANFFASRNRELTRGNFTVHMLEGVEPFPVRGDNFRLIRRIRGATEVHIFA